MREDNNQMRDELLEVLDSIKKQLDIVIAILLTQSGLKKTDVAKVIGVTGRTIQRMIPFKQIRQNKFTAIRDKDRGSHKIREAKKG